MLIHRNNIFNIYIFTLWGFLIGAGCQEPEPIKNLLCLRRKNLSSGWFWLHNSGSDNACFGYAALGLTMLLVWDPQLIPTVLFVSDPQHWFWQCFLIEIRNWFWQCFLFQIRSTGSDNASCFGSAALVLTMLLVWDLQHWFWHCFLFCNQICAPLSAHLCRRAENF